MLLKERYLMNSLKLLINMKIDMKEKDKRNEFLLSRWICNSSFDSAQAKVTRKKKNTVKPVLSGHPRGML